MAHSRPLTPADAEQALWDAIGDLEESTEAYDDISAEAAKAEAWYKREAARKAIAIIASGQYGRGSAKERDARIELETTEEHETYLVKEAARHSAREHLLSLRIRIEALRTISSSIRGQA